MYKVIEEREEVIEALSTIIYEYDHQSLESALNHIDLRSNQNCKCYMGSNDKKSVYRRNLMELDKEDLINEILRIKFKDPVCMGFDEVDYGGRLT